jgi:hypothetical protein
MAREREIEIEREIELERERARMRNTHDARFSKAADFDTMRRWRLSQTLLLRLTDAQPDLLKDYASDEFFPTEKIFECKTEEIDEAEFEQFFGGFGGQVGAAETAGVAGYTQPKDAQKRSTKGVFGIQDKEWLKKVFREAELEAGAPICRPGFRVVVSTNLPVDAIKEKLGALLPLSRCKVIAVKAQ